MNETLCRCQFNLSSEKPERIVLCVPKLWEGTIDAHREAVRTATLDATASLVAERGLTSVTMSDIAKLAGIGRATLYKYFADVEAILSAWHERQINRHLVELAAIRDCAGDASQRLEAVLKAYARIAQRRHGGEMASFLHQTNHVAHAQGQLLGLVRDLLSEGARNGDLRNDVSPNELASYCLHALSAAGNLSSDAALARLVKVTLSGVRRTE